MLLLVLTDVPFKGNWSVPLCAVLELMHVAFIRCIVEYLQASPGPESVALGAV